MICRTSTIAAISVIILLPNSWSCQKNIVHPSDINPPSKQKRGNQCHRAQYKCNRKEFGNAKQAHLGVGSFHQRHRGRQQEELCTEQEQAAQSVGGCPAVAQSKWKE